MIGSAHRSLVVLVVAAAVVAWPKLASACPVCFGGDGAEAATFVLTTALLTLTPFVVVGGIGFWLVKRIRQSEAAQAAARESSPGSAERV